MHTKCFGLGHLAFTFTQMIMNDFQVKSRGETVDAYGSVGPIRRIRNKIGSGVRPRGSIFLSSSKEIPSKSSTTQVFGGFLPNAEKNVIPGETSLVSKYWSEDVVSRPSDRDMSNTNISSSQAAKKVLELLDRNKPTPKQEAELKLATAWRSSPDANDMENRTSAHVEEPASQKNTDISGPNFPFESDKGRSKFSILGNFPGEGMNEARDAATGISKVSNSMPGADATPIFGLKGTSATQSWNKVLISFYDTSLCTPTFFFRISWYSVFHCIIVCYLKMISVNMMTSNLRVRGVLKLNDWIDI